MAFPYDIVSLIKLVEARPCLWDKSCEYFRDKPTRHKAWNEIYHFLEENYDELTNKEKKQVGAHIKTKWANIRDAFLRSLKIKLGQQTPKKTYLYGKHLHFLLKCKRKENCIRPLNSLEDLKREKEDDDNFVSPDMSRLDKIHSSLLKMSTKVTMSTRTLNNSDTQVTEEMEESRHEQLVNDENFFQSFVPYIRDMTENERLDLQLNILNSIKKIKQSRAPTYTLHLPSQTWTTRDNQ